MKWTLQNDLKYTKDEVIQLPCQNILTAYAS